MDTQVAQRYSKVDLFSMKGRMGRRYYLFYSMIPIIFLWLAARYTGVSNIGIDITTGSFFLFSLTTAIVFFILVYLTIQRCHDFDKSGWYAIFVIIPFSNLIYASISSINGLNRYGEMPEEAPIFISTANYLLIPFMIISMIIAYFL
ncbi:MAG TPA: DUF805 domain-containing protein [Leucothrix sp.]|nr:DUF805 domain-containing protein [Leucothrix sp.]HIQ14629.1 DUF805 domain-containing protein [Leucothrix sp.]